MAGMPAQQAERRLWMLRLCAVLISLSVLPSLLCVPCVCVCACACAPPGTLAFVIITTINTIWYSIEEGFRVPAFVPDPSLPGGVREIPYHEQNSTAFTYVRALRLILHFGLVLALFITGWDMLRTNGVASTTCAGHTDLVLYFKVFFYVLGVGFAIMALVILCGGLFTCATLFSNVQERRRARGEAEP